MLFKKYLNFKIFVSGSNTVKNTVWPPKEDSSSDSWSDLSPPCKYNKNLPHLNLDIRSSQSVPHLSDLIEHKASEDEDRPKRPLEECVKLMKADQMDKLTDDEIIELIENKEIRLHALDKVLNDYSRGVKVRRKYVMNQPHMKNKKLGMISHKRPITKNFVSKYFQQ